MATFLEICICACLVGFEDGNFMDYGDRWKKAIGKFPALAPYSLAIVLGVRG